MGGMLANAETMRAVVCTRYGPAETLVLTRLPVPPVGPSQIRVKVHAASVSAGDRRLRARDFPTGYGLIGRLAFGWTRPRRAVLGGDLSGVIDAVGAGVTRFRLGDEVVALTGMRMGSHAEYCCVNAAGAVCFKPPLLSHERAAAALFGGAAALDYLRRARLGAGETLLVVGASGAVGSAAVQWAYHLGARVTAVCRPEHADWITGLGAEQMVDGSRQPWPIDASRFDVLLDATGTFDWPRARSWLQPEGRFLSLAGGLSDALRAPWLALTQRERIVTGPAAEKSEDICTLMQALVDGTLTPHIDAVYPLARIRDAHRHADRGRQPGSAGKRGTVIVLP